MKRSAVAFILGLVIGAMCAILISRHGGLHSRLPTPLPKPDTVQQTVNMAAQIASQDLGLHEAMIDYAEQFGSGEYAECNVFAGNHAFRYELRGEGACHVVEGTIGKLNGLELRIAGDETVYQVWVSSPR